MRGDLARFALLSLLAAGASCSEPAKAPGPKEVTPEPPPAPEVRAGRSDLVFSWTDPESGRPATTSSIGAVPEAARAAVVVTDLSRSPSERQAAKYVFVADLRGARPDGSYPVSVMSRFAYRPSGAGPAGEAGGGEGVIVYSTSWCGVCKKAKALLKTWGVPYVEKDVEASKSAADELAAKSQRAHLRGGGVPVIDVAGTLLEGLDEARLRAALQQKGLLKS